MEKNSRLGNAGRNVTFGMLLKAYQIIMPFLMRTAMMYAMGMGYLGLNSLFGSVLWVLNLAELGVGSAMVYSMYQPIIDHDTKTICALLKLYRKYYRIIGAVIAIVGSILTPFIPYLVKSGTPADINIYIVYLLNLLSTVLTYWLFAYKNSLLTAHQRNDVASKVMLFTNTIQYLLQLYTVIVLKDYYIYLIVQICTQVVTNLLTAYFANKMYPEYHPKGNLALEKIRSINQKIKDVFTMKVGQVIVSSVDTIVTSAFLGLTYNAIYNNYNYVITAAFGIVKVFFDSCMAGIGNSILTESPRKNFIDLKKMTLITLWMTGYCCVCLLCLFQPFMTIWAGKQNLLDFSCVICFVVYFFLEELNQLLITYKDAAGIWHQDRFRPLVTAFVNLALSIILVQFMGIDGVILATVISILGVGIPWILYNLFTTIFKEGADIKEYIRKLIFYTVVTIIVCAVSYFLCTFVPDGNLLLLILKGLFCTVVSNIMFFLFYFKTAEFDMVKQLANRFLHRNK